MELSLLPLLQKNIAAEIALQCGDPFFEDFNQTIYAQAIFRSSQNIARDYKILNYKFTISAPSFTMGTSPIPLTSLKNIESIRNVYIYRAGSTEPSILRSVSLEYLTEHPDELDIYHYDYVQTGYQLYYNQPDTTDIIDLYITYIYDETGYDIANRGLPELPETYKEELIRRSVIYIAKLGIALGDFFKREKYKNILSVHTNRSDIKDKDSTLQPTRDWIIIKPFRIF